MKPVKMIKENQFLALVLVTYITIFVFKTDLMAAAVKNSSYYIMEMLKIMPVVFVLTTLLDIWVPKETIIKYLGRESGTKGMILAFLLGSVSAGPIYAAFPICIMLLQKGASIQNIVIILSSWAVIKFPMLVNEVQFLGFRFMAFRWILTVIAIIIFSQITALIVRKEDLSLKTEQRQIMLNTDFCIGCSLCAVSYPQMFEMKGKKATLLSVSIDDIDYKRLKKAAEICPVKAINIESLNLKTEKVS